MPFADALAQISLYVKFLKEMLSNKKKLEEVETITLNEECSAIIQHEIPPKLKDPGSFSLPCTIGQVDTRALCDLGASVSLIPYSMCRRLGLGELKKTRISLQLADRTVKRPLGIIEDVFVTVDKFVIPCDFVVIEMDEDVKIPIILGRPFLATAGTHIDVKSGKLSLNVGDDKVEFDLNKAMERKTKCYVVDVIENTNPQDNQTPSYGALPQECFVEPNEVKGSPTEGQHTSCFKLFGKKKKKKRQKGEQLKKQDGTDDVREEAYCIFKTVGREVKSDLAKETSMCANVQHTLKDHPP